MKLTKKFIDAQEYNGSAKHIICDGELKGFGVRLYPTGNKSFVMDYRDNNRKSLMVIGSYSKLTLDQARKEAKAKFAELAKGINPLQKRQEERQGNRIKDLCAAYIERHAVNKKSGKDDISKIDRFIIPEWGNLLVRNIKRADVAALHTKLGKLGHYQANRAYSLLSKMFNLARVWGFVPEEHINPCFGIQKFKEEKRDRFVSQEDEFPRLAEAINAELNQTVVSAIWLYLLTGVRKDELLTLKWADIDLNANQLTLTDTKNGKSHHLPLSFAAVDILNQIPRIEGNPFVLVGKNDGCHFVGIDKPWQRIRKAAELDDLRLHDLRRTVGSWLAQSGNSLHLIGKVLNHSNQSTTAIYARFGQDSVRDALEQHGQLITGMVGR